jgi:hypothetical protein
MAAAERRSARIEQVQGVFAWWNSFCLGVPIQFLHVLGLRMSVFGFDWQAAVA